jgi:hypothetical protein
MAHIEDEAHALLECGGHEDLVAMCYNFLQDVKIFKPKLKEMRDRLSTKDLLLQLLQSRIAAPQVAKYVYVIFNVYCTKDVYVPAPYLYHALQ